MAGRVIIQAWVWVFVYNQALILMRKSAEKHTQQSAVQATGKMDALLRHMLTVQISTNATVQRFLAQETEVQRISFGERQSLQQEVRNYEDRRVTETFSREIS
ncbi:MAG: hypothetical protein ACQEXX_29620 [Bacillota bacterium]